MTASEDVSAVCGWKRRSFQPAIHYECSSCCCSLRDPEAESSGLCVVSRCQGVTSGTSPVPLVCEFRAGFDEKSAVPHLFSISPPVLSFTALTFSHRTLREQIYRWVIDRVDTLNVARIRLHFLHILKQTKKQRCDEQSIRTCKKREKDAVTQSAETTNRCRFGCWAVSSLVSPGRMQHRGRKTLSHSTGRPARQSF